jgi:hypothetical protein
LAVVGGLAVLIVVATIIISNALETTPGSGTKTHPAAADVSLSSCGVDPTLHVPEATGTVLNHSSGKSNYTFNISFLNPTGTVAGQKAVVENGIERGQTANFTVYGESLVSGPVTCKINGVTRFAAP